MVGTSAAIGRRIPSLIRAFVKSNIYIHFIPVGPELSLAYTFPWTQNVRIINHKPRVTHLVSALPSVHKVTSSIPGDITSLFQLLSFLCSWLAWNTLNTEHWWREGSKMSPPSTPSLSVITVTSYGRKIRWLLYLLLLPSVHWGAVVFICSLFYHSFVFGHSVIAVIQTHKTDYFQVT